ncbi:hypothetical protein DACRYDRAFT_19902 [Dacryopinax primogenitus]|uniref:F-box domain-containing protein n=1 Tax=Dacryopinax primogenitus (strain DJM 731) TaxID=1858805 RepID=M5GAJ9_DACPD|nr:uncharacterized protein DACRYDRAFT_19902 [Dacryopinax primogenitus]EJU05385.1 hypothetical protein DACRYDRAFT_19902 [Dacryopinax primogenitus]
MVHKHTQLDWNDPDIFSLPNELWWSIWELLADSDLLRLSQTCRMFRALTTMPISDRLYRHLLRYKITAANTQRDGI